MSYRDLRNLGEILRAVGYPRLVSIENFRNPNFPLVADISRWLVLQYEPKADIPSSCDTERERVTLIRSFAEFMLINVQVKLNTKRLYQADGYAVKELLKVASVLYNAVRDAELSPGGARSSSNKISQPEPTENTRIDIKDLKETRSLTSHLVQKGVGLYDMLSKEVSLREARSAALSKAHEHAEVERLIKSAIETGGQEAKKMTTIIETIQNNAAGIDSKIEKKKMELDRSQKRLLTLKKVRPAFMDEYEELQQDLAEAYTAYVNRFRCLAYVQSQIEDKDRLEEERKLEERLTKAELSRRSTGGGGGGGGGGGDDLLSYGNGKGGTFINSDASDDDEDSSDEMSIGGALNNNPNTANNIKTVPSSMTTGNSSRSGGGGHGSRAGGGSRNNLIGNNEGGLNLNGGGPNPDFGSSRKSGRRVYGSMMGAEDSEDESDMILVDGDNDNSELVSEEDEDELVAIQKENLDGTKGGGGMNRSSYQGRPSESKQTTNSYNNNNNNGPISNGTANGGKGYPVDTGRSRSTINRPTTGGRKAPPASDDDDF